MTKASKHKVRADQKAPMGRRGKKFVSLSEQVKHLRHQGAIATEPSHEATVLHVQQVGVGYGSVSVRKAVEGSIPKVLRDAEDGAIKGVVHAPLIFDMSALQSIMAPHYSATAQVLDTKRRVGNWVMVDTRESVSLHHLPPLIESAKTIAESGLGASKPLLVYAMPFQGEAIKAQRVHLERSPDGVLEFTKAAQERLEQLLGVSVKLTRDRVKPAAMPLDSPESKRIVKSAARRVINEHAEVIRALADR